MSTKTGVYKCPKCGKCDIVKVDIEKPMPEKLLCHSCVVNTIISYMLPTWKESVK